MKELWEDIKLIYQGLNFSGSLLMDDLIIISQDNHYLLYYKHYDITTQIRIEKDYNLVRTWSYESTDIDMVSYKLHVEEDGKVELDENHKIELVYKIITPFLRQVKLKQIGV